MNDAERIESAVKQNHQAIESLREDVRRLAAVLELQRLRVFQPDTTTPEFPDFKVHRDDNERVA